MIKKIVNPNVCRFSKKKMLLLIPLVALLSLLSFQSIRWALADPLCCADDSMTADAAKSLALGLGYAQPIAFDGTLGRYPFDPGISIGPTLILPAAAAIYFFGADPSIPGLVKAVLSLLLLFAIILMAIRRFGWERGTGYGVLFVICLFLVTTGGRFVQWYAIIGELTSALLLVFAAILATTPSTNQKLPFFCGISLSLAVLTKLLALLALPVLSLFIAMQLSDASRLAFNWRRFVFFLTGFALPILLFLCWQFATLGVQGTEVWFARFSDFVQSHVRGSDLNSARIGAFLARAQRNILASTQAYGHSAVDTSVSVSLLATLAWSKRREILAPNCLFIICLALLAIVNLVWWTLFVDGHQWPRYELIGMIATAACVAGIVLLQIPPLLKATGILAAILLVAPLTNLSQIVWGGLSAPTADVRARIPALKDALEPLQNSKDAVLIGSWWAALAAPRYMLPETIPIVGFNKAYAVKAASSRYLLLNPKWDNFGNQYQNPSFIRFMSQCTQLLVKNDHFSLFRCD